MNERLAQIPWPPAVKRTRQRLQVLEAMLEADRPLTALELSGRLEKGGATVWLSTVYRVLDTFTEHGLVQKTAVLDGGMAVYELKTGQHRHYAVCLLCNRVIPLHGCPLQGSMLQPEEAFHVIGHRLQLYGYCGACAAQGKTK